MDIGTDVGTRRDHLHAIAAGKAILATMEEDRLEAYLASSEREQLPDQTITDEAAPRDTLETARERGYAFNDEESFPPEDANEFVPACRPVRRYAGTMSGLPDRPSDPIEPAGRNAVAGWVDSHAPALPEGE